MKKLFLKAQLWWAERRLKSLEKEINKVQGYMDFYCNYIDQNRTFFEKQILVFYAYRQLELGRKDTSRLYKQLEPKRRRVGNLQRKLGLPVTV